MDMYCTRSPTVPPAQFMLNVEPRSAGPNSPLSNVRPWQEPQFWSYAILPWADCPAVYSTGTPAGGFAGGFAGSLRPQPLAGEHKQSSGRSKRQFHAMSPQYIVS